MSEDTTSAQQVTTSTAGAISPGEQPTTSIAGATPAVANGASQPLPEGEQIPRLSRPQGELARNLPSWDPEPPAFLIKRSASA
ncbi:MAG: hypothetical protein ACRDJ3_05795 [Solirubrobacteraceae bacterium]